MYSDEYSPNRIYLSSFPVVGYCRTTRSQYNIRNEYKIHHCTHFLYYVWPCLRCRICFPNGLFKNKSVKKRKPSNKIVLLSVFFGLTTILYIFGEIIINQINKNPISGIVMPLIPAVINVIVFL